MKFLPILSRQQVAACLASCLAMSIGGADAHAQSGAALTLTPSATFAPGGKLVQDMIRRHDFAGARAAIADLAGKASTPGDRYALGNFHLEIGRYFQDEAMQRQGLEMMLETGLAPVADAARLHYYAGQFALNAKDFTNARRHLEQAADAGEGGANTQVYLAEAYFGQALDHVEGDSFNAAGRALVRQGLPHLRKAIAMDLEAGRAVDRRWIRRGFDMARLSEDPDLGAWRTLAGQYAISTADL